MTVPTTTYIGRFAPSPSGPLHFGSLVAAVGSYLDARAHGGTWLVRMEDIDPPREVPGADDDILRTLEAFGLQWDGEVMYQSNRDGAYRAALDQLAGQIFYCTCTRAQLRPHGGIYPGTCRSRLKPPADQSFSIRMRGPSARPPAFHDLDRGQIQLSRDATGTDPILRRKDGLWAYQLAVVVDDAAQGITRIVRGHDLFTTTPLQVCLQRLLNLVTPQYLHLPLVMLPDGRKLSKQNQAPPIVPADKDRLLRQALHILGLACPTDAEPLTWGIEHWAERVRSSATGFTLADTVEPPPQC